MPILSQINFAEYSPSLSWKLGVIGEGWDKWDKLRGATREMESIVSFGHLRLCLARQYNHQAD